MRVDVLKPIVAIIEDELEKNAIKSVVINSNEVRVEVANGRAFARMFPKKEERVAKIDSYRYTVEAYHGNYVFFVKFEYSNEFEDFTKHFPVAEDIPEVKDVD